MKKTIKFIASYLLLFVVGAFSANAEWSKETRKEFNKSNDYRIILDMSETNYEGMDSIGFVEYHAAKNKMTASDFGVILKYIDAEIAKQLSNKTQKKCTTTANSNSVIYIQLDEITGKAGLKATVNTYVGTPENGTTFKVKVDDGRWNKFDVLLQENCEELAKKISKHLGKSKNSVRLGGRDEYDSIYL